MSRKWTVSDYQLKNRNLRYRLSLAESQSNRLSEELKQMTWDRNHYRQWVLNLQDKIVEWLKGGLTMNLAWYIRNITETRGAGLP